MLGRLMWSVGMTASTCALLSGCALFAPQSYVKSDEVSLPAAGESVACFVASLRNGLVKANVTTDNIVDEVKVNLKLKASADGTSTLAIDTSKGTPGLLQLPVGISYTDQLQQIGERNNEITITLKHLYTADLNDPGKARLKKEDIPFGTPAAQYLVPLDKPCEGTLPVTSVAMLRHLRPPQ